MPWGGPEAWALPRLRGAPEVQVPFRAPGPSCPTASLVLSIDCVWWLQPSGLDFVSRETSCESHARLSSSPAAQWSITCGQEKGSKTAFSWPVALAGQQAPPRAAASVWADGCPEQPWSTLRAPLSDRPPGVKLWTVLFSTSSDHSKPFPEASQLGAADQRARLHGPGGIYVQLSYIISPRHTVPSEETSLAQVDCNILFMSLQFILEGPLPRTRWV